MNQKQFIHDFAEKTTYRFNAKLFSRSDEEIIEVLKKIILSCQRETNFKILVRNFRVVDSFFEVNETLRKYQEMLNRKKSSKSRSDEDNRYNFIDLKQSALKLLIVTYYIEIKDQHEEIDVIIAVPRVVDKFYFYINGNYCSSMYQIVDGSTYNNATSKSDSHCVTLKTMFHPIRIFRNIVKLYDFKGEEHDATQYDCMAFSKCTSASLYVFAQYGFYNALEFFGLSQVVIPSETPLDENVFYSFQPQYRGEIKDSIKLFFCVPKQIFDGNAVVQHVINMLCTQTCIKDLTIQDIFSDVFWKMRLGNAYTSSLTADKYMKGCNVLTSLRGVYSIDTRDNIRLPEEYKRDVFRILQWVLNEFSNLKLKDNLNIRTKRINIADYIGAMYGNRLAYGIYNLSDNPRADIRSIRKSLITNPMFLVSAVSRSQLITFRNTVTDMDSIVALKCTYKGESGIGETSGKSIPKIYRYLDVSNMGVLDPDASSPSDPGISGSVVPLLQTHGNGFISDFQEPITWGDEYEKLYDGYKKQRGLKDVIHFKKSVLGQMDIPQVSEHMAEEGLECIKSMMEILHPEAVTTDQVPVEGSGTITYE